MEFEDEIHGVFFNEISFENIFENASAVVKYIYEEKRRFHGFKNRSVHLLVTRTLHMIFHLYKNSQKIVGRSKENQNVK